MKLQGQGVSRTLVTVMSLAMILWCVCSDAIRASSPAAEHGAATHEPSEPAAAHGSEKVEIGHEETTHSDATPATTEPEEAAHKAAPVEPKSSEPVAAPKVTGATTVKATSTIACPAGQAVMQTLSAGNARFLAGSVTYINLTQARRMETATKGQRPKATILSCSDSRVPVEAIFDQGIGDVFPIRVAGNVCGPDELATVEYGVGHLNTPLVVVMGHSKCGAVTAAATHAEAHGHLPSLLNRIAPAVTRVTSTRPTLSETVRVDSCIRENVWTSIETLLARSQIVRDQVKAGKVKVVGAFYDISSGKVTWLGVHPRQNQLLATPTKSAGHGAGKSTTKKSAEMPTNGAGH